MSDFASEDCVRLGISRLDVRCPGWRAKIDWELLDMQSLSNCILGQLFHSYGAGYMALGLDDDGHDYACGFDVYNHGTHESMICEYAELTRLWKLLSIQ